MLFLITKEQTVPLHLQNYFILPGEVIESSYHTDYYSSIL